MKANTIKNKKIRKIFFTHEKKRRVDKFLSITLLNEKKNSVIPFLLNVLINSKQTSKVEIKNKCVLTGRNKSIDKKYSFSRLILLNMLRFGILPGSHKAVW